MGRRASSSINSTVIIAIVAVVAVVVGVGALMLGRKGTSFNDVAPLRIEEALENANSLRGNEYRLEGTLLTRWPRDDGSIVEVLVDEGGRKEPFPIMIPPEISNVNFEREQRYAFKIRFEAGGVAVATAVKRL